jgi:Glycosyl hydrolase family 99
VAVFAALGAASSSALAVSAERQEVPRRAVLLADADVTVTAKGRAARTAKHLRAGGGSGARAYVTFKRSQEGSGRRRASLRLWVKSPSGQRIAIRRAGRSASRATTITKVASRSGWLQADVSRLVSARGPQRFVVTGDRATRAAVFASRNGGSQVAPRLVLVRQRSTASAALEFPVRAAFYYPWFPETWTVGGQRAHYRPELGFYDSGTEGVVEQHVRDLDYAHVDAAIFSWWGRGEHKEEERVPRLFSTTRELGSPLRWIAYYEKEGYGNPSVSEIRADLSYLRRYTERPEYGRVGGKPVLYVYGANDFSCEITRRYREATEGRWHVVLKVFPGYRDCQTQPNGWHQYAPSNAVDRQDSQSFTISPGFWRADESAPRLGRNLSRWKTSVKDMVKSGARWQLITSFNEWGEGTGIEPTRNWSSGRRGDYLDALHDIH